MPTVGAQQGIKNEFRQGKASEEVNLRYCFGAVWVLTGKRG